ncbi:MFS transporter [Microbacterium sp. STN6]|uniref:MFS transporter n=1 Tax=Microbacterium sp. STN6 TaxID=2995588 RepID=UPI0022609ABA|nr:MFS transporter [Microbacterium sp. STN6]MCX7522677.1 MFS transporter [Microbacterium sp. STN6]
MQTTTPRPVEELTQHEVKSWRNAIFLVFVLSGLALATWVARIPGVRDDLHLSTATVGLLILGMSIGSIFGLIAAPPTLARLGARRGMMFAILIVALGVVLIGVGAALLPSIPLVSIGLILLGFGNGACDVMMNVEAAAAEKAVGKTIMPLMHACFSVGTVGGAGIGAAAAAIGVPVSWHLIGTAIVIAAAVIIVVRYVPTRVELGDDEGQETGADAASASKPGWRARLLDALSVWADMKLILIGIVMLGMAFAEGSANDWIALATVDGHHQSNATGALYLSIFVAAMTVGRVLGGPFIDRFGRVIVIQVTAVLGVAGLLMFIVGRVDWLVIVGVALWGMGASLGFPVGMSAAADDPKRAAARVSAVAMIGYCAFLVGPPLIGFLGQTIGLLHALFLILALIVAAGICAPATRHKDRPRRGPAA